MTFTWTGFNASTILWLAWCHSHLLIHTPTLLGRLQWLLVEFRIRLKLACLTYKALTTSTPIYLQPLVLLTSCPAVCHLWLWVFWLSLDVAQLWALVHSVLIPQVTELTTNVYALLELPFLLSRKVSELAFLSGLETGRHLTALLWQVTNSATRFALLCALNMFVIIIIPLVQNKIDYYHIVATTMI